ncbi:MULTISPECIES: ABC transporter substrate-binding protein [Pseudomonas]|uniref:ABC transporter substrate-binding protein n=1 Tax=Pseudomonas koreensis TaxID=198620 RepID=A0A9X3B411_9PSED|nr:MULTISPECIES: ABC transporter substrate-binding protein [Pseudomonas]MBV4476795.1 ABC transporter substrate-binding protein [Pseudomonas botevensis]MCU7249961.1 ABC transporter substrate-binding protein [Pseudomonas koreensis]
MVNVFRRRQTFTALLFAGLLGLSLSALTPDRVEAAEPDPALASVTDLQGRTVKVHLPVRRVILGEGRQLYLVAALDTENPIERIVGWRKDLIQSDPDTYNAYLRKFPEIAKIPTFGGFESGTFDIEQAISQKPDVIILNIEAQHATEDARYIEKLDALGIPVVYVDFRNNPMQNTEPTMRLFGKLFGKEERAEAFIDFRNRQIRRVTDVIEAKHPARPNVFIERIGGYTDDCCLSFGNENFGLFVDMAGGNNIARRIIPSTFGQLNPEQVIVANPDHVVVTSADWEAFAPGGHWVGVGPGANLAEARRKLQWYTHRPAYAGIKAQDTQAFHAIWHQFYNSPYQFVAIQQFAKWFHPELFADLDPDAAFREMHERFLPVPYEPGYFVSLQKPEVKP